ncbi:MAG TPA: GNAT family N-acetyltransferase [Fusibacter sp.]|nr:GNAT family N-acetyltransferase [Fusibacter sp.]
MREQLIFETLEKLEKQEHDEIESCVQVITRAFKNDPLFTHALCSDVEKASFSRFLLKKSMILGEKSIVMKDQTTILGVASYEKDSGSVLKGLIKMVRFDFIREIITLKRRLSSESFAFFNRYMRFTTSVRPKVPHYYLVFIGIVPEAQGRGFGRTILEEIHARADADEASVGIGLDTENEANVAYYEKFGYKLIDQRNIDSVTVYAMFRSKVK